LDALALAVNVIVQPEENIQVTVVDKLRSINVTAPIVSFPVTVDSTTNIATVTEAPVSQAVIINQGPPGSPGIGGSPIQVVTSVDLLAGQPVYVNNSGQLALATASVFGTTRVLGLVGSNALATFAANVKYDTLTLTDWINVIGTSLLTPNVQYYLSPVAGQLTNIAPTIPSQTLIFIGHAVSSTTMGIAISFPILL
jgi:hypothetical protein